MCCNDEIRGGVGTETHENSLSNFLWQWIDFFGKKNLYDAALFVFSLFAMAKLPSSFGCASKNCGVFRLRREVAGVFNSYAMSNRQAGNVILYSTGSGITRQVSMG